MESTGTLIIIIVPPSLLKRQHIDNKCQCQISAYQISSKNLNLSTVVRHLLLLPLQGILNRSLGGTNCHCIMFAKAGRVCSTWEQTPAPVWVHLEVMAFQTIRKRQFGRRNRGFFSWCASLTEGTIYFEQGTSVAQGKHGINCTSCSLRS